MFKLDLEKAEEPEIKLPTSVGSYKKQRQFQKNVYLCFTDYAKAFYSVEHNKLENYSRDGNTREICEQIGKQQLESDVEQWTGSKLGK